MQGSSLIDQFLNYSDQIKKNINHLETTGIYNLEYISKTGKEVIYIDEMKIKIIERIKKHKSNKRFERLTTALFRMN